MYKFTRRCASILILRTFKIWKNFKKKRFGTGNIYQIHRMYVRFGLGYATAALTDEVTQRSKDAVATLFILFRSKQKMYYHCLNWRFYMKVGLRVINNRVEEQKKRFKVLLNAMVREIKFMKIEFEVSEDIDEIHLRKNLLCFDWKSAKWFIHKYLARCRIWAIIAHIRWQAQIVTFELESTVDRTEENERAFK